VKWLAVPYQGLPCELATFEINSKRAYLDDFGFGMDENQEAAEPYACADYQWRGRVATTEVLEKYDITLEEYEKLVEELEELLSVGGCGWCV
jgi:hypothetical protein